MTIAGLAVGATQGYIYLRSEYPHARARADGRDRVGRRRRLSRRRRPRQRPALRSRGALGAGAYICGEETSMLESLEGKRGDGARPSRRCRRSQGLFGQPTVDQQRDHARHRCRSSSRAAPTFYREYGVGRSRGTLPFQLAGNIRHGGLVEKAFGLTLRELLVGLRRRLGQRPADPRGAGRRAARRLRARVAVRHAARLRGLRGASARCSATAASSCFDDTVDMAQHGALRDGVLRDRVLRQVHAVPHRLDARRRGDRPDHRATRPRPRSRSRCCGICATRC